MMILWVPIPAFRRLVNHKRQIARRQENSESYWQIFQINFIMKAYVEVFWFLCPTYHISFRYITAMFRVHCHLVFFSNQVLTKKKIVHDGESIIRLKNKRIMISPASVVQCSSVMCMVPHFDGDKSHWDCNNHDIIPLLNSLSVLCDHSYRLSDDLC